MRSTFLGPNRSLVMAKHAMVATSHTLASAAAHQAYLNGGNAMDAALTAVIVQGVVDPAMTGVGGDCFCLIAQDGAPVRALNGSGRSPSGADLSDLKGQSITMTSPAAITVPGAVHAWGELHAQFGTLPWAALFEVAIGYARDGFPVLERVAYDWQGATADLQASATAAPLYLRGGAAPAPGETWRLPDLARTLEQIAKHGAASFYTGELAEQMVAHCQACLLYTSPSPRDA